MPKKKKKTEKSKNKANELKKINDLKDKNISLLAEFDNYRKRIYRERISSEKYEGQKIFNSIIPIIDDIDRLLSIKEIKEQSVIDGVNLIKTKFLSILKEYGVVSYNSVGELFNPEFHEAIMMKKTKKKKNTVIDEFERGYMYHDRVLRHAKVIVGE